MMRAFDGDGDDAGTPFDGGGAGASFGGGGSEHAVPIPDGVTDTAAGADLATLLEDVPVERVSGHDAVAYMKAAYRLATHYHGLFLKAMLETGLRVPAPDDQVVRAEVPGEFAAEEARAALVWSRSRAEGTFGRAYQMFGQHRQVGDALVDASLDEPRAKAFCDWTAELADEHATRVIDELLPEAGKSTVGELIDRIKRMAIALDPDWAERRYRESARRRRVELRQTPDGTADLAGRDLPTDRAKIGADRIDQLARACKSAGDERRIDTIRADLFLGMLDGLFTGMTDQQIVDHVLAHPIADDPTDPDQSSDIGTGEPSVGNDPDNNDPDNNDPGDDGQGGGNPPRGNPPGDHGGGSDSPPGGGTGGGSDSPPGGAGHGGSGEGDSPGDGVPTAGSGGARTSTPPGCPGETAGAGPGPGWSVAELRVELSTLLGLDRHPAELPGLGCIPAAVARPLAACMGSAEWRFVICTPHGVPICSGITIHRPAGQQNVRRDPKRGGILELQLTSTQLFQFATAIVGGDHTDWQNVISDIAERYRHGILDTADTARARGTAAGEPDPVAAPVGSDSPGNTRSPTAQPGQDGDTRRRRARAGLRRWIEVRDRYCLHPACRMPATRTDQDHRNAYAAGGLTVEENLDCQCRHDHRLQHDGGWIVTRLPGDDPLTGTIVWISPLGHRYPSRPPPVMQPYPEPGSHYPGEIGLPAWFTRLAARAKAAQHDSTKSANSDTVTSNTVNSDTASTATGEPDATGRATSRRNSHRPAEPPF